MRQAAVCWDNAMAQSLWATLTTEYYYRRDVTIGDQVYTGVATWIEDFYNRRRIHTSLGGRSPSNTNYTKRPGQQPHKQTVNNVRTGPMPPLPVIDTFCSLHDQLHPDLVHPPHHEVRTERRDQPTAISQLS